MSQLTVNNVNKWLKNNPNDVRIDDVENQERSLTNIVTPTGYSFVKFVSEIEWSSKSIINAIYAMYHRHLKCTIIPDPIVLRNFS